MTATIQRRHEYRISSDGVFIGLIPNVTNEFEYTQEINTAGTEITIEVGQTLDTASEAPEIITTEAGDPITTESGYMLATERSNEIVGVAGSGAVIANNNDVEVYEISSDYPNGVLVFSGYISRWGASSRGDKVLINCISYGKDLDDYIFGNVSTALQVSQTTQNSDFGFWGARKYGQTFLTGGAQTEIVQVILSIANSSTATQPRTYTLEIWNSPTESLAGGTPLATASVVITDVYPNYQETSFIFAQALTVTPNTSYFFSLAIDSGSIFGDTSTWGAFESTYLSPLYADGKMYVGGFSSWNSSDVDDFYFKIYSGTILTDASFTAADPSGMIEEAMDSYNSQGGIVQYTASSIDNTGVSVDYDFRLATILEQIRKARELAPAGWYWYVDPATQTLYFKATPTTATHLFTLGRHLEEFSFEASVEDIVNNIYFTGGPTGGINLLKQYTDDDSLATNRRGMRRVNDNRILAANVASAEAISNSLMEENSTEEYRGSPITILADTYDISTIHPGDTVTIQGYSNFIDSTIFQITRLKRHRRYATLTLGRLPLVTSSYVDQIKRDLDSVQTLDNPNTPS